MAYERGTAGPDRAKALAAVVLVHAGLGAVILTGLNVERVTRAVERLQTIDIRLEEPPPPVPPPPPQPRAERARKDEGVAGKKADPTPVVAPKPKVVLPVTPPVVTAPAAGTGSASSSGAAAAGSGTGAGGSGSGRGGGGTGDYSGFTPARLTRNLNRSDYRQLAAGRLPAGRAMVSLNVGADGLPNECRILRSSGDPVVDAGLCPLVTRRLRFSPARDAQGRPIPYGLQYVANWSL